jgi:valyl-tRNA synthetase
MWEENELVAPNNYSNVPRQEYRIGNQLWNMPDTKYYKSFPVTWFQNRLNQVKHEVEILYSQFKLSEALKVIYSLIWDDFCSWYLEWVKPGFEQPVSEEIYNKTIVFFEKLMQLLHPFMPFITEEIYGLLQPQSQSLCVSQFEKAAAPDKNILQQGELLKNIISAIRDAKNKNQIKPKDVIKLHIQSNVAEQYKAIANILAKQINASDIFYVNEPVADTIIVTIETDKFFIETERKIDTAILKDELLKDLAYQKKFLESVLKKLSNERFVQNAKPEVVAIESKKQTDAEARIKTIEDSLKNL